MAEQDNRDEFVFEDEVNQEEPEYTKESYDGATENIKSLLHNKRLMMLGGAVIGLWVLTYLFDAMTSDSLEEDIESVVETSQPVATPQPVQPQPVLPDFSDVENKVKNNADGDRKSVV